MDGGMGEADWKVGVDIGGTFIDICALDTRSGRVASLKVLTTPDDPGAELMTGLTLLAEREGMDPGAVTRFVHGTTVGMNTVIQRKGAPLVLLTNAGFEDVIELARLRMPDTYSLFCSRPDQLVARDMRSSAFPPACGRTARSGRPPTWRPSPTPWPPSRPRERWVSWSPSFIPGATAAMKVL